MGYKKREQIFWFKKLTVISKQNTIFVEDVNNNNNIILYVT
jgi:hypothetical protein